MSADFALDPFFSTDENGEVHGVFSLGLHSEESLKAKAIECFGLEHSVIKHLLDSGYFEQSYFRLNSEDHLIPTHQNTFNSFPVSMWRKTI